MAADRAGLVATLEEAHRRLQALTAERDQLGKQLEEQEAPSYSGLGDRASELLRLAEEQSAAVITQARAEATKIIQSAKRDAATTRAQVEGETQQQRATALREIEQTRERNAGEHDQMRNRLKAEAEDVLLAWETALSSYELNLNELKTQISKDIILARTILALPEASQGV